MRIPWLFALLALAVGSMAVWAARRPQPGGTDAKGAGVPTTAPAMLGQATTRIALSEEAWRKKLTPEQYHILREQGTESPRTGPYWDYHDKTGTFTCAGCGLELFSAGTKFDSGTGWPSFYDPIAQDRILYVKDDTLGMTRIEVRCARCGGHLGHVFDDGPAPTGQRYCIDGYALGLVH